jgi:glutamate-1-semialdehyde 2,1-aminomutase
MTDPVTPRSPEETDLLARARRRLPGGVLGTARYADDVGFVVKHGRGSKIYDVSGREYIDYVMASGPLVLGHAHPAVVAAVRAQLEGGTTYFMVNEPIIALAEEICRAMPCAEQVRFTSTGSEATFFALRVARTARGRDKILKFEGGYHGAHDYAMMSSSPRSPKAFPAPQPDSAGIPHVLEAEVLIAPYNDLATVEGIVATHADELAAVIVEPFQRLIPPQPGFLAGLRELTRRHDVLLIFDEVVTGFRFAYGGAQEYYGVTPDICTLGKIIGGGFPLAAIAGRADMMKHFDKAAVPEDKALVQIGTLSGNPVASAAGLATMAILKRPGAYEKLFKTGNVLKDGLARILKDARMPAQVIGEAPMFDAVFTDQPIQDYRGYFKGDQAMARRVNSVMLREGILKSEGKTYVSLAHTEADVAKTLAAWEKAVKAVRDGTA